MKRITQSFASVAVLALSAFLWSCDNIGEPTQPRVTPRDVVYSTSDGQKFTVVREKNGSGGMVSATIGAGGGKLTFGEHELYVSAGAVSDATLFTIYRDENDPLRVKLTAGRDDVNDVGSGGFAAPVTLTFSWRHADEIGDPATLTVVYLRTDGFVDPLPTTVHANGKRASADVPHFSGFALAWPL